MRNSNQVMPIILGRAMSRALHMMVRMFMIVF